MTMSPFDAMALRLAEKPGSLRLLVVRRVRIGRTLAVPGMLCETDSLPLALRLVGGGYARPLDERTRRDVELGQLLRRAIPRAAAAA